MLARAAAQALEVVWRQRRRLGLHPPPGVERLEDRQAAELLDLEVVLRVGAARHQPPAVLPLLVIADVVAGPALRVAEDRECLVHLVKLVGVAGLGVVGMIALRQEPVDAVDRVRFGVDADLQHFVVIELSAVGHARNLFFPGRHGPVPSGPPLGPFSRC